MKKRYHVVVTFYENKADHPNAESMDDLNGGTVDESFDSVQEAKDYGNSFKREETYRGFVVYDKVLEKQIVNVHRED